MNSYTKNLHATVVNALWNQELELDSLKSQFHASLFSLYYAQDSCMTTAEKLQLAYKQYDFQKETLSQAIMDSNMSTNILHSTIDVKGRVDRVVANTATAAADTQIAVNAIEKLASGVSAIYSIMSAIDFDGELYDQAQEANKYMQETTYLAETVSQQSMEASSLIASAATTNLLSKATSTNTDMISLLNIVTTDFNNAKEQVTTIDQTCKSASEAAKSAEGNFENANVVCNASEVAYQLCNEELNLSLNVSEIKDIKGQKHQYRVSFNPFISPFKEENEDTTIYPVAAYYIFLVMNRAQSAFTTENAASIIAAPDVNKEKFVKIEATNSTVPYVQLITTNTLKDVNGDSFQLGDNYVVFVYADLSEKYKKSVNVFEGYLTAPSASFTMTNHLIPAFDIAVNPASKSSTKQQLYFQVNKICSSKVTYRCIFLLDTMSITKKSLETIALEATENKNEKSEICFNLDLAEHIPAGSYTIVKNVSPLKGNTDALLEGTLELTNTMTDNFGNRLIKGNTYIPVIMSMSDDIASINKTITNALSDFKNTQSFTYLG